MAGPSFVLLTKVSEPAFTVDRDRLSTFATDYTIGRVVALVRVRIVLNYQHTVLHAAPSVA